MGWDDCFISTVYFCGDENVLEVDVGVFVQHCECVYLIGWHGLKYIV